MAYHRLVLAIAVWASAHFAASAKAVDAPRVRQLVRSSQLVGVGRIAAVEDLDFGKIRVYQLVIEKDLKPGAAEGARTVRVVSLTDQPGAVSTVPGKLGVAFVQPLQRNSYFDSHLPNPTDAYQFSARRDGWLEAAEDRQLGAIAAPVETIVGQSRKPATDAKKRSLGRRSLVFALLSAPHPLLLDDGITSLSTIQGLSSSLTDTEAAIITSALHTASMPISARKKLIAEIARLGLKQLASSLRELEEPGLQEDAWAALRRLDEPVSEEKLQERLASEEPGTRLAAARELLSRDPKEAIPLVSRTALRDRDKEVRVGTIEALGGTKSPEAVPPLESVFTNDSIEERQAAARSLLEIGGDSAADALHRLAFTGPIESQRYAVIVLLALKVGQDDRRVVDIKARHTDDKINDMLDGHGFHLGHKH